VGKEKQKGEPTQGGAIFPQGENVFLNLGEDRKVSFPGKLMKIRRDTRQEAKRGGGDDDRRIKLTGFEERSRFDGGGE